MGMNPNAMQQPAQSSVRTLGKSKPITLSSLGAGKIGYNGSKSLSTSTPAASTPAPALTTPAPTTTPATPKPVETPKTEEKKVEEPIETVETLDTPEEMVEDTTPSVVSDFLNHIDLQTTNLSLDEIIAQEDPRENVNVVFIGHVDAGKSTICGSIMYITGMVDKRTIEKFEREAKVRNRESWFLAYIMDTNEEERAKV